MQRPLFRKPETPNFADPAVQRSFIELSQSGQELYYKELTVNQEEQNLLHKRILMMREFINDLPASDPQYSMLVIQVQMDQIELDELKARASSLNQKLSAE